MYSLSTCHDKYRFYNARFIVVTSRNGHIRVLLAFYTPSVTSKSHLISLLFLERPIFVFQALSVWRSLVLALILFRAVYAFARRDNFHGLTSVLSPLMRRPVSYGRIPRPEQALSGTTVHTTKTN